MSSTFEVAMAVKHENDQKRGYLLCGLLTVIEFTKRYNSEFKNIDLFFLLALRASLKHNVLA